MSNKSIEHVKRIINLEKELPSLQTNSVETTGKIKNILLANDAYVLMCPKSKYVKEAIENKDILFDYLYNQKTIEQVRQAYHYFSKK